MFAATYISTLELSMQLMKLKYQQQNQKSQYSTAPSFTAGMGGQVTSSSQ